MVKEIYGTKVGMTQIFDEKGVAIPVTAIEVKPLTVVAKKTADKDGYNAIVVSFGEIKEKNANKPHKGIFAKAGVDVQKYLREIKVENVDEYEIGSKITVDTFTTEDSVDVQGTSKGKGFQGVIKRHGQHIGPKGHGSGAHRIVGSMGPIAPNRIAPGKKLPGQMGHVTRTVQNLEIVAVDVENNLLLIKGSVPGPKKGLVIVKSGIKAAGRVNPAHELVDFTPTVEETKDADVATDTPVETAE